MYSGYFTHPQGADISFTADNQPAGSLSELKHQFALRGVAAGMFVPICWSGAYGVTVGGSYSFCYWEQDTEVRRSSGGAAAQRGWRAEPQHFNLHLGFSADLYPSLKGLVGLKYESFQVNFTDPQPAGQDTATLALSACTPYLGFVYWAGSGSLGMDFRAGMVGFPALLGWADFRETVAGGVTIGGVAGRPGFAGSTGLGQGYFLDTFAEVSAPTSYGLKLGAYVKYDTTQSFSNFNVGESNAFIPGVTYKFNFQKRSWGVGGFLSWAF